VTMPDSLTQMGANPFARCANLTEIRVSADHPVYEVIDGVLFDKTEKKLICDPYSFTAVNYTVPAGTESIGVGAFYSCDSLASVTLPEGLESIGDWAFYSCYSLASVTLPDSLTQMGANPFALCANLTEIRVSADHPVYEVIDGVLFDKTEKKLICYPYSFTAVNYTVPAGTESIGVGAFYSCDSLASVTLPEGLLSIGEYAFYDCDSLASVTLPESLESIGDETFYDCPALTLTVVENSLAHTYAVENDIPFVFGTSVKAMVDAPAPNVTASDFEITVLSDDTCEIKKYIGSEANVVIPEQINGRRVVSIGDWAFYDCDSLASVTLPEGVARIGLYALAACDALERVTLPEGLESIGRYAFFNCYSLQSITLPESLRKIEYGAFNGCESLTAATLPAGLETIEADVFLWCPITLTVTENTPAHAYAVENGLFIASQGEWHAPIRVKVVCDKTNYTLRMEKVEDTWYILAEDLAKLAGVDFSYNERNNLAGFIRKDGSTILYLGDCIFINGLEYVPAIETSIACGIRFCEYNGELLAERLRTPTDLQSRLSSDVFNNSSLNISNLFIDSTAAVIAGQSYQTLGSGVVDTIINVFKQVTGLATQERYDIAMNSLLDYNIEPSIPQTIVDRSKSLEKLCKYLVYGMDTSEAAKKQLDTFFGDASPDIKTMDNLVKSLTSREKNGTFKYVLKGFKDISDLIDKLGGYDALVNLTNLYDMQASTLYVMNDIFEDSDDKYAAKAAQKIVNAYEINGHAIKEGVLSLGQSLLFVAAEEYIKNNLGLEVSFDTDPAGYMLTIAKDFVMDELLNVDDMAEFLELMPAYSMIQLEIQSYFYDHIYDKQPGAQLRGAGLLYLNAAYQYMKMLEFDQDLDLSDTLEFIQAEMNNLLSYDISEFEPDYDNADLILFAQEAEKQ